MLTSISNLTHKIFKKIFGNHFDESGFIAYANNIQWFTIAKIVSLLLSFFTTIVVARILGPEQFGILNYVLSVIGLFSIIANLGIGSVVYRELIVRKEKREVIFGSAFFLNIITAIATIIIIFIGLFFIKESFYVKSLILLMSVSFLTQPLTILTFDFLKDKDGKYVTITQITTLFISSLSKIIITYYFASIFLFIIILVLENIITGLLYLYQIKKIKHRTISFKIDKKEVISLFYLSLPLLLYGTFSEIYARIDQIMLRSYIDIKAVGLYSASVRLTELWYMIPNILLGALFPALANVKDNQKEYEKRFKILLSILTGSAISISFLVFFLRDYLIKIIYGNDFIAASPILGVYIFSLIGFFISLLLYQDLFLRNNKWLITLIPLLTAILNIVLNIILIPKKGSLGAALATVVSYNLVAIGFYFVIKIKNRINKVN